MTQTEYHLKLAIYHWCGVTPDKYVPDSNLRDIWASNIPTVSYEPEGIQRFFQTLYTDPFFTACPAAHTLRPGEFIKGGDLQTVGQVYVRLLTCGNIPVNFNTQGQFE